MSAHRTPVVIIGGYHDGLSGTVDQECVRLRFTIMSSHDGDGAEWWHGYYWDGAERDRAGRLVFRPRTHVDAIGRHE